MYKKITSILTTKFLFMTLAITLIYLFLGKIGQFSAIDPGNVSPVWPPSGFALALVLIIGKRSLLGIFLGAVIVNMIGFTDSQNYINYFNIGIGIGVGSILQPLLGSILISKYINKNNILKNIRNYFTFIFIIPIMSLVSSSIGTSSLYLGGLISQDMFLNTWFTWWLGDGIGIALFTPFLLIWRSFPVINLPLNQQVKLSISFLLLILFSVISFSDFLSNGNISYSIEFITWPFLLWIALHFSKHTMILAIILHSIIAIVYTKIGQGPFVLENINQSLLILQLFLLVTSTTILIVALLISERKEQEKQFFIQSRQAQMGEMISMIAHQWRQPLAAISATAINLKIQSEFEKYNLEDKQEAREYEKYINNGLTDIDNLIQNLTHTIDDFRNFYKPTKKTKNVSVTEVIQKALKIIKSSILAEKIKLIEEYNSQSKINIHDSEMIHVILNILKNSLDNFMEKNTKDPYIKIITDETSSSYRVQISDNGGGIPSDIVENIFDPYFSTKSDKNGTGIGLYMSKIIVEEHHNGKLSVKNTEDGVCFRIILSI